MNDVTLIGRLGQDPETKTVGETSVTKFSMATSQSYKDKDGNKIEDTQWHNCECWGKRGEAIAQYVSKGQMLAVKGEVRYDEYETDSGEKRKSTKIKILNFEFLPNQKDSPKSGGGQSGKALDDDDIPF